MIKVFKGFQDLPHNCSNRNLATLSSLSYRSIPREEHYGLNDDSLVSLIVVQNVTIREHFLKAGTILSSTLKELYEFFPDASRRHLHTRLIYLKSTNNIAPDFMLDSSGNIAKGLCYKGILIKPTTFVEVNGIRFKNFKEAQEAIDKARILLNISDD